MDDVLENLNLALAEVWKKYRKLPERPDSEMDSHVVRELSLVVDRHLGAFRRDLLADTTDIRSILVRRLEETLFGKDLRVRNAQIFLMPKAGPELEFARAAPQAHWRLQPRRPRPVSQATARTAALRVSPPGTQLAPLERSGGNVVTRCAVQLFLDPLPTRRHRVSMLLPASRSWHEISAFPEVSGIRGDDIELPLPEVFGSERGQWKYPEAPLRICWWTEPEGVPEDGGGLGPADDGPAEELEHAWMLWLGKNQAVGRYLANLLELELDLEALRRLPRFTMVHQLEIEFRFPAQLGAQHVFIDHARVSLGSAPSALEPVYQPLFEQRYSEYAKPGHWQLENEGVGLRPEDVLVTSPGHTPADENTVPTRRLDRPVQRRNLLRSSVKPRASIVTIEDLADAADDLLSDFGHVERSGVRGVPTWLEDQTRLRDGDPRLDDFAGFIWVVPFVPSDPGVRTQKRLEVVASMINRRLPIGCRAVFELQEDHPH